MAQIKKISTELQLLDKFLDTSGDAGTSGQVLTSTGTGINWVSGGSLPGGPYLPLDGGTMNSNASINMNSGQFTSVDFIDFGIGQLNGESSSNFILKSLGDITYNVDSNNNGNSAHIFQESGNELMRIRYDGKVGIGTPTPDAILHVKGSTNTTEVKIDTDNNAISDSALIKFNGSRAQVGWIDAAVTLTDGGGNKDIKLKVNTGSIFLQTNNTSRLIVADGGNVGIGTTSPGAKLEVEGRVDFSNDLRLRGTDSSANQGVSRFYVDSSNKLYIDTANDGSNIFVIDSGGNVGIGATPRIIGNYRVLDISGASGAGGYIGLSSGSTQQGELYSHSAGVDLVALGARSTRFFTNSSERMRITSSGNVGIGTTSPGSTLPTDSETATKTLQLTGVSGNTGDTAVLLRSSDNSSGLDLWHNASTGDSYIDNRYSSNQGDTIFRVKTAGTPLEALRITGDGNVGIGTTSPSEKLEVSGSILLSSRLKLGTGDHYLQQTSGDIYSFTTGKNIMYAGSAEVFRVDEAKLATFKGDAYFNSGYVTTIDSTGSFYIDVNANNTYGGRNFRVLNNGTTHFNIDADGDVGVNTTNPSSKFEVLTTTTSKFVRFKADNNEQRFEFYVGASGNASRMSMHNDAATETIRFAAAGNSYFNSGNVGIGTTSPQGTLSIKPSQFRELDFIESNSQMTMRSTAPDTSYNLRALGIESSDIVFRTGSTSGTTSTQRMVINSSGNVGIGTTSPDKKLEVSGDIKISGGDYNGLFFENASGTTKTLLYQHASYDALIIKDIVNNADRVTFKNNGNVGIGTTSPGRPLTINSDTAHRAIRILENDSADESWDIGVDVDGDLNFFNSADTSPTVSFLDNGTATFAGTVNIVGTNSTNQESVLLRGIAGSDLLGSIRTANTGGYNQEMRFYTSNASGSSDEDLTLTLKPDQSATFAGAITMPNYIVHYGDPNTKFGFGGLDSFQVDTSGTTQFSIDTSGDATFAGRVAIGTTTQTTSGLDVYSTTADPHGVLRVRQAVASNDPTVLIEHTVAGGNADEDTGLVIKSVGSGSGNQNPLAVYKENGTDRAFKVDGSGNGTFAGNVNVGGTNVTVSNATNPYIYLNDTNAGAAIFQQSGNDTRIGSDSNTQVVLVQNNATAVTIDTNKNVGIGTTSPGSKLEVSSGAGANGDSILTISADTDNSTSSSSPKILMLQKGSTKTSLIEMDSSNRTHFSNGDGHYFSGGNVGIGTTSPTNKLHIQGSQATVYSSTDTGGQASVGTTINNTNTAGSTNNFSQLLFTVGTNNNSLSRIVAIRSGSDASDLAFVGKSAAGVAEYMRIKSGGNVGIGTTSPTSSLEVLKSASSTTISEARISSLVTGGYGGQANLWLRTSVYGNAMIAFGNQVGSSTVASSASGKISYNTFTRVFTVTADSNDLLTLGGTNDRVGINQTSPQYTLDVTGNGRFTSTVTATNFINSSDERLKENIEKIRDNNVEVNWKTFNFKTEKEQKRYGVIAQELEKTNPEFVREDSQGFKSVAYIDLLIAKIAELEARIQKLEK